MEQIVIAPQNVCSRQMIIDHENGVIKHVQIIGGCDGNSKGVSSLLIGMTLEEAVKRLSGITCRGSRNGMTSCPNELAKGLAEYLNK